MPVNRPMFICKNINAGVCACVSKHVAIKVILIFSAFWPHIYHLPQSQVGDNTDGFLLLQIAVGAAWQDIAAKNTPDSKAACFVARRQSSFRWTFYLFHCTLNSHVPHHLFRFDLLL